MDVFTVPDVDPVSVAVAHSIKNPESFLRPRGSCITSLLSLYAAVFCSSPPELRPLKAQIGFNESGTAREKAEAM